MELKILNSLYVSPRCCLQTVHSTSVDLLKWENTIVSFRTLFSCT